MSVLKSILFVVVIGCCTYFIFPVLGGNCCSCCCGPRRDRSNCLLCLKEEVFVYSTARPLRICAECYADCEGLNTELRRPYLTLAPPPLASASATTPLLQGTESPRKLHSSPSPAVSASHRHGRYLNRWCTIDGVFMLMEYFINGSTPCTRESLIAFIELNALDKPRGWAQSYMGGLHIILASSHSSSRSHSRSSTPVDVETWWHGRISDCLYRSFLARIRIIMGYADSMDGRLLLAWTRREISHAHFKTDFRRIIHECALGWPGFVDREEALRYWRVMPPMYEVMEFKDSATKKVVGYLVAVPEGEWCIRRR